jgi:hypothetical protein
LSSFHRNDLQEKIIISLSFLRNALQEDFSIPHTSAEMLCKKDSKLQNKIGGIEAFHKNRNNNCAISILCQGPVEGAELYHKK